MPISGGTGAGGAGSSYDDTDLRSQLAVVLSRLTGLEDQYSDFAGQFYELETRVTALDGGGTAPKSAWDSFTHPFYNGFLVVPAGAQFVLRSTTNGSASVPVADPLTFPDGLAEMTNTEFVDAHLAPWLASVGINISTTHPDTQDTGLVTLLLPAPVSSIQFDWVTGVGDDFTVGDHFEPVL